MQPTPYNPSTDFSEEEVDQVSGRSQVRTAAVDLELAAVATTLGQVLANIAAIQRDDLKLIDRAVELHTLSTEVLALIGSAGFTLNDPIGWLTATNYAARSIVKDGTGTYVCVTAHTSGTFATDLAAGKWVVIFDSASYVASAISFSPTGGVAASNVQAAIAEVDSEKLAKASNLSDVANVSTSRDNLSVPSRAGIQNASHNSCAAGGTADVITGAYSPAITAYANNMILMFEAGTANTSATPSFNADGVGAKTIVRPDGGQLFVGDIPGANYRAVLVFDSSSDKWMLLNPFYAGPAPSTAGYLLKSNGPGVAPSYQAPDSVSRIGEMVAYPGIVLPSNAFECDGTAYSRTTYANLFAKLVKFATATISIATPGVVTWAAHGLLNHMPIKFTSTGALPTGLTIGRTYWIINKATDTFQLALTPGGVAINTSGSQSGVHTAICAPYGDGDGSTTFNVPNAIDRAVLGYGASTTTESFAPADVNTGTDNITVQDNVNKWVTGMLVVFTTTVTAPTGLTNGNPYYVIRTAAGTIKLASSLANAQNGTAIDLTTQGSGVHTITHTRPTRGLGEAGGEDAHAMSLTELLAHTHVIHNRQNFVSAGYNSPVTGSNTELETMTTDASGGNGAMNIMGPWFASRWIIYHS